MEEVAWRYVERGDVVSAERLFAALCTTFSYTKNVKQNNFPRYRRLCKVVADPMAVPNPQRQEDAVEALLEERFPLEAFFTNSTRSNMSTLNKWMLIVHPDKNPHPQAKKAFLRLTSMKEELISKGLLSGMGLANTPTHNTIKTSLPPVVNFQRMERENHRMQEELDTMIGSMKKRKHRVRLNCDLTLSSFDGTLRDLDLTIADDSGADEGGFSDEDALLTRTIVMEGVARSDCHSSIKRAVTEALGSATVPNLSGNHARDALSQEAGSSNLHSLTHNRISLKRPPSLEEWRKEVASQRNQPPGPTLDFKSTALPPMSVPNVLPASSVHGSSLKACEHSPTKMAKPQSISKMKEFVIPIQNGCKDGTISM